MNYAVTLSNTGTPRLLDEAEVMLAEGLEIMRRVLGPTIRWRYTSNMCWPTLVPTWHACEQFFVVILALFLFALLSCILD
jgi:hypothetical protein